MDLIRRSPVAASTTDFIDRYHAEKNQQGKGNALPCPSQRFASARPETEYVAGAPWWVVEVLQSIMDALLS